MGLNAIELREFLLAVLQQVYPSEHEDFLGGRAWAVHRSGAVGLVGVLPNPDHIRLTVGVATDIAFDLRVGQALSNLNAQLWIGRAYWTGNEEINRGSVVMQDIAFGDEISWDSVASMQAVATKITTLTDKASRIQSNFASAHRGRVFRPMAADVGLLLD